MDVPDIADVLPDTPAVPDSAPDGETAEPVDTPPVEVAPADTTAPTIEFKNLFNGTKVSGTFTVEVDAKDDKGVASVQFSLNNTPVETASAAPFSWKWDTTAFAAGNWFVTAIAVDGAGNKSEPVVVEVIVANKAATCGEAPKVKLVYPTDKAVVCGDLGVETAASGPCGVTKIEFFVDDKKIGEATEKPYKTPWKTATLKDGPHLVKAVATDAAKQQGQQTIAVQVNNKQTQCVNPPTVFLTQPADDSYVFGKIAVEAESSAGGEVATIVQMLFSVDGSSVGKADQSPWATTWDTDSKTEGAHTLKAIAKDNFDKLGVHQITVNVDRTDPSVGFASPNEAANVNGDATPVTVAADASDNSNLAGVAFSAGGKDLGTVKQKPYQVTWNTAGTSSGNVTLKAVATDAAGHKKETTRVVVLDRAPKVSFQQPAAGSTVAGAQTVTANATDDLKLMNNAVLKLDGSEVAAKWQPSKTDDGATLTYQWDTPQAVFGEHELTAEVTDSGGHKAMASLKVKVDQPLAVTVGLCDASWQGCKAPNAEPKTEYTGKLYVQVGVADDNATANEVQLQVDGKAVQTLAKPPWQFTWDSATVKDGSHELAVKVTTTLPESKTPAFGLTVNNCDLDKDGHLATGGACGGDDCDDKAPKVYAGAVDLAGNATDENCDGLDGVDADSDKVASIASGGKDCDDANKLAYPCADELSGDATDTNCDGKLAPSCDDCLACSQDSLIGGKCVHAPVSEGAGCDDGDACTVGEVCTKAACGGAKAKDCNDGNVCTADACNPVGGCVNSALNGPCDLDATACTPDACTAGVCKGGAAVNCDDKNGCTADSCDAKTGLCVNAKAVDGAGCDDGDLCTLNDACAVGVCKGAAKVCGANEVCAAGVCKGPPTGMALIPAGSFKMGCVVGDNACSSSESPQHTVTLAAYYMDVTEVTVAAYMKCVDAGKCTKPSICSGHATYGVVGKAQHPVNCVKWTQADAYCKWTDAKGRLPTEAEWEKAARGGLDGKQYPWGDQTPTCTPGQPNTVVWSSGGNGCGKASTWAVGTGSSKNGYGLYDMSGNVWEWVNDWYSGSYYGASPASNPTGPASGSVRVVRGGGFYYFNPAVLRASVRGDFYDPSAYDVGLGFRCSRSLP